MPVKTFTPVCIADQVFAETTGTAAQLVPLSVEVISGRVYGGRFTSVDIPKGSTINSATLTVSFSAKTPANAQTATFNLYYETTNDQGAHSTAQTVYARTTQATAITGQVFTWNTTGASFQTATYTVTSAVSAIIGGAAWAQLSPFVFVLRCTAETDALMLSGVGDGHPWVLTIDYTPPASDGFDRITSVIDGTTFRVLTSNQWESNAAIGTYKDVSSTFTSVATTTSPGTLLPAGVGNASSRMLRFSVAAADGLPAQVNHTALYLPEGVWATFMCWAYVPAGAPNIRPNVLFRTFEPYVTTKDAWVQLSVTWLTHGAISFVGVNTSAAATGSYNIHLYQPLLFLTDAPPAAYDGNTTDTAATTYDWAVPLSSSGDYGQAIAKTKLPTTSTTFPDTVITAASADAAFTYADANADPQTKFQLRTRRTA